MIGFFIVCLILAALHLPSALLLWKTPNGRIALLLLLLFYGLADTVSAYLLPADLPDDFINWPTETIWIYFVVLYTILFGFFFAYAWKIRYSEGYIPQKTGIISAMILLALVTAFQTYTGFCVRFSPEYGWMRHFLSAAGLLLTALAAYYAFRDTIRSLRLRVYPSVIIAMILFSVYLIGLLFSTGRAAFIPEAKYYEELHYDTKTTPDGIHQVHFYHDVFFYKGVAGSPNGFTVYCMQNGEMTMDKIVEGSGGIVPESIRISNDSVNFSYRYSYGGRFFGLFGSSIGESQISYSIRTGELLKR